MRMSGITVRVTLVLIGLIGAAIFLSHVVRTDSACLLYDTRDDQGGEVRTVDPTAGLQIVYHRPPAQLLAFPGNGDLSPNAKNQMYLTGPKNGPYSLYIDSKPLRQPDGYSRCVAVENCWIGETPPHTDARLFESGIQRNFTGAWLSDDQLIYTTLVDHQQQTLVVKNTDGSTVHTLPVTFSQNDKITFATWSNPIIFDVNQTDVYVWFLTDGRLISFPALTGYHQNLQLHLSPQGKYLTFADQGKLVTLSIETKARSELILPGQSSEARVDWSPDERYFVLEYGNTSVGWHAGVYRLDGTMLFDDVDPTGFWSEDSSTYYGYQRKGQTSDVIAFNVEEGRSETIFEDIHGLGIPSDNGDLLARWAGVDGSVLGILNLKTKVRRIIAEHISQFVDVQVLADRRAILYVVAYGDQYSAEMIDENGSNHLILLSGMKGLGEPQIINGGKTLLYLALTDKTLSLETINLDRTDRRILAAGLEDVTRLYAWKDTHLLNGWNDAPDIITFVGKRNGVLTAEVVLPQSGVHRVLAEGLAAIEGFGPDSSSEISFSWQKANLEDGVDGYTLNGQRIYHLTFPGHHYPNAYQVLNRIMSPDKRIVAVEATDPPELYLMAADGSWVKPVPFYQGLSGAMAWSPDGKQFAFLENDGNARNIVITDENGNLLRRIRGVDGFFGRLTWNHCEY